MEPKALAPNVVCAFGGVELVAVGSGSVGGGSSRRFAMGLGLTKLGGCLDVKRFPQEIPQL